MIFGFNADISCILKWGKLLKKGSPSGNGLFVFGGGGKGVRGEEGEGCQRGRGHFDSHLS